MNLRTGFAAVVGRLNSVIPIAVQTAEILGDLLSQGTPSGETKARAVQTVALEAAQAAAAGAGVPLPDLARLGTAIRALIDSHVALLKLFQSQTAATATEPTPTVAADVAGSPSAGVDSPPANAGAPQGLDGPPLEGEKWREVDGVRYVWDPQSEKWASAGR